MPTLVYSSSRRNHQMDAFVQSAEFQKHYELASRLIDAIFASKEQTSGVVVVERNRFTYVPADGSRKMVIRLKRVSL